MSPSSLQPSQLRWHRPLTDADRSPVEFPSVRSPETTSSYGQILTSSAVIGGSSLVTMLAALVRNKFVAVFLGPAGVGLMSLFGAMTGVVGSFAGLGISTSGVREISEAAGAGDRIRLARSVTVVRRVVARLGLLGAALLAAFCRPISRLTLDPRIMRVTFSCCPPWSLRAPLPTDRSPDFRGSGEWAISRGPPYSERS